MTASLIDRLKKIKALAESGVAGEAENARDLLARLLHENGLTADDLKEEPTQIFTFTYRDSNERKIIFQVYRTVTNTGGEMPYYHYGKKKKIGIKMTIGQYLEVRERARVLLSGWRKQKKQFIENMISAFCAKNGLFDYDSEDDTDEGTLTKEALLQINAIMEHLKKIKLPHKRIAVK